ncbi:PAS domain-containing protein [Mucilaginibacter celer]|uniref:histidine kinase n=1 Tax=Mucilaginibacter celer TaxID=2305508 RepID=A0A494W378_9SPHI|nr:PAS domain-containing protein [Mucilaginibacter celer]AYL97998.1 PAS domain S-box protein [Mucilaginibacter celer]
METGNKLLHSIFDVTHVEFQTFDLAQNKLAFSSGMACQLLGYSDEEYRRLSNGFYKEIIHPDDLETVQQTIARVMNARQGEVVEMTARFRKGDGSYIWLYSRQMIFERAADGRAGTIIRQVEDVTRLINLQYELKSKVEQLNLVSFKNSHLLRSPVASIIGLVNIIEEQEITSEHNRQILHFLKDAITRLDEVIHEINDVARPY